MDDKNNNSNSVSKRNGAHDDNGFDVFVKIMRRILLQHVMTQI